jgi:hypothetical protein
VGRVGWGARSAVSLDAGVCTPASSTTGTGGKDELEQRSFSRSSCLCCRSGTAGSSGEPAQRHVRTVVSLAQHDCCTPPVWEQQQPQQHCFSRQASCFVAQDPTDGTTAVQAVAAISKRETKFAAVNRNMNAPLLQISCPASILLYRLSVKSVFLARVLFIRQMDRVISTVFPPAIRYTARRGDKR